MEYQKIILQGGEDVKKRTDEKLMEIVYKLSDSKNILVVPWTSKTEEKEFEYRKILLDYFLHVGFKNTIFLDRKDDETEIIKKFSTVDVLYLPGGDPEILYNQLSIRNIDYNIKNFKGIIIGNSAGAIVLSKGSVIEGKFYRGFGILNFYLYVHYRPEKEMSLYPNIGLQENAWIFVSNTKENSC